MKRIISVLLVSVMLIGTLAGCGKKNVEALPEGTVTLTVGLPQHSVISDYDENAFTKYLEEKTNVDIEFVSFSSSNNLLSQ